MSKHNLIFNTAVILLVNLHILIQEGELHKSTFFSTLALHSDACYDNSKKKKIFVLGTVVRLFIHLHQSEREEKKSIKILEST